MITKVEFKPGSEIAVDLCAFTGSPSPEGKQYVKCRAGDTNKCGQVYVWPPGQMCPQWVFSNFISRPEDVIPPANFI